MGQVQVDHRRIDLFMPKELLDRVEMCAGLQQMRGKAMAQRMDGRRREIKLLAGHDDEALQGTVRHGSLCRSHPFCQSLGRLVAASHIGKQPARMPMKAPILAQILQHQRRQWDDTVLMAFAIANDELALIAENIVNG